jgi:DNA-directed RNA polymerase subunit F
MNVLNKKPLTLAELKSYGKHFEENKVVNDYLKTFTKLTKEKADKLMEEVRALNSPKIKEENIIKLADMLPEDAEDINKIFLEVSLSEEESNAILNIVKQYH